MLSLNVSKNKKFLNLKILKRTINIVYTDFRANYENKSYQKQPLEVFCNRRCIYKFCKIPRKIPVLESLFPATLLKMKLWHKCFPVNFAEFLRTPLLQNTSGQLLLSYVCRQFCNKICNIMNTK